MQVISPTSLNSATVYIATACIDDTPHLVEQRDDDESYTFAGVQRHMNAFHTRVLEDTYAHDESNT